MDAVQHPHQLGSTENMVSNDSKMVLDEKPNIAAGDDPVVQARLRSFVHLKENMYKTERLSCKEAKKMTCDCFLTEEEISANEYGCGEDCLNRLLLIECGDLCQVGDRCTNKRFQKSHFAPVEVFNTDKKGLGLRAAANIPFGEFILEYVGEVLNTDEFDKRAEVYSQDKNIHYYFMALRADAIIDATMKGNISRFINHSCDPNAETQKWTVNGELRIGFFSTRTILAGEEITFDYRFQRYGKEAQKCYCGAAICRGWLGEQPDSDEEEEEVVEEEMVAVAEAELLKEAGTGATKEAMADAKAELPSEEAAVPKIEIEGAVKEEVAGETIPAAALDAAPVVIRKKVIKKKPRIEMFEEIDQLNEEIDMLVTTGLKNQAHTLKLSRLMVRAKEPQQRAKLLRVLRKGELPCRRLFLDYHGLRLIHGYMIDAQHLVMADKKFESQRLEMLQTLAVLPIPNKTMLQDSKVLPTVELWSTAKELTSPLDSDSNSPQSEQFDKGTTVPKKEDIDKTKIDPISGRSIEDQEEEIRFLATKLLEEWRNLKEVFKIPKKERIEQMKEHEREANKKFMQSGYGQEPEKDRKSERYRNIAKIKERDLGVPAKRPQKDEKFSEIIRLTKVERRKLFALQHELKEEQRRLKQRELWRQHEMNCMMMGTDPRFTAPFDPSRPYQCIWNPQIGQWQNYPLPPGTILPPGPTASLPNLPQPNMNMPQHSMNLPQANLNMNIQQTSGMNMQHMNIPPSHQVSKNMANYPYGTNIGTNMGGMMAAGSRQPISSLAPTQMAQMNPIQVPQVPASNVQMLQYQEQKPKDGDPSQVKFMGPIPPPVKLPPKWKCAKDKYGRPYYYHIKIRKSQWEPPPLPPPPLPVEDVEESSETESSSDTSSLSSSSDSDESEDALDDTKLLQHVRRQMEKAEKAVSKTVDNIRVESMVLDSTPSPTLSDQPSEDRSEVEMRDSPLAGTSVGDLDESLERPSIDIRLKEQFSFMRDDNPSSSKKRRVGLCEEIIISPRSEEDKKQMKEDLKRYRANKEKLRRQKELLLRQSRLKEKERLRKEKTRLSLKEKIKEMPDFNSEIAKKIKETFRANMASTVVTSLNAYRKSDCREGRITNTEDFKHLARKLTHFVMLKEMKHISKIDDLTCTDNVKMKAREYIRKYMSKFGEVYVRRNDSPDFKD
nr:unnamed protein product [Callosobruchus chinensis]